jgi:lysyl-tRNA synthetase class 2
MMASARVFFAKRGVTEVDCPALSSSSSIDAHIDVMKVDVLENHLGYLHTSPEYGMKRLLADGIGDIYQLSHVFRKGELSKKHQPEFTMVEWYRIGLSFEPFIEETLDFIRLFLGELPSDSISYRNALKQYAGIDYVLASTQDLLACAKKHQLHLPDHSDSWDKDTLLQLLISFVVEPHLGQNGLTVLWGYPASQAALAQTRFLEDEPIAERFEIYYRGIELCNGYHELTDALEQRRRLAAENEERLQLGKQALKIDEHFLKALEKGIPDCCGVAVGFDRLMLLRHGKSNLEDVLPLSWQNN